MATSTPIFGWPIPTGTDPADVPYWMSQGLTAVENSLGSAWTAYTPTWGASTTNPTIGNGSIAGAYRQLGKTIMFRAQVSFGTTTTFGAGGHTLTAPVTQIAGVRTMQAGVLVNAGTEYAIWGQMIGNTSNMSIRYVNTGTTSALTPFGAANPVALTAASPNGFWISGTYEAA